MLSLTAVVGAVRCTPPVGHAASSIPSGTRGAGKRFNRDYY
jgi:hypothetical protein